MSLDNLPVDELQRLAEAENDTDKRCDAVLELVRRINVAEKKAASNERYLVY